MPRKTHTLNTRQPFFYGHLLVTSAFLIMVAIWALYYSFGVFFKPILNEFGWTRAMTSGAFSLSSVILGFMSFGFLVGGAIGPLMTGYIFDIGRSYAPAFLLCAGVSLAGLVLSGLLRTGR